MEYQITMKEGNGGELANISISSPITRVKGTGGVSVIYFSQGNSVSAHGEGDVETGSVVCPIIQRARLRFLNNLIVY